VPFRSFISRSLLTLAVLLISSVASRAHAATITGTVFEDRNYGGGAGRSLGTSAGAAISGARVELYNGTTFVAFDTTDGSGNFSFTYSGNGVRRIRVVNGTVRSTRTGGSGCTTCVAIQTYRAEPAQLPA
jgi:hypothetical protein